MRNKICELRARLAQLNIFHAGNAGTSRCDAGYSFHRLTLSMVTSRRNPYFARNKSQYFPDLFRLCEKLQYKAWYR